MLIEHAGKRPRLDATAWVAPDATVCGDVTIGPGARVLHGARIVAEGSGRIEIGRNVIVMENAVVRGTERHACAVGDHCLIGPNSHVVGATIEDEVFIATGVAVFHGARLGRGAEVRVNGTVHLRTHLGPGTIVPIGWIAVGNPAEIFPPDRHEEIWALQKPLNFPEWVYGVDRGTANLMIDVTTRISQSLAGHAEDRIVA